ncbi:hypothetical protein F5Y10DRAFT_86533 [Nemania abortiva]|nr:hypothetical protein F5Y10DRAFT_86533 [Nemania abortiva]
MPEPHGLYYVGYKFFHYSYLPGDHRRRGRMRCGTSFQTASCLLSWLLLVHSCNIIMWRFETSKSYLSLPRSPFLYLRHIVLCPLLGYPLPWLILRVEG